MTEVEADLCDKRWNSHNRRPFLRNLYSSKYFVGDSLYCMYIRRKSMEGLLELLLLVVRISRGGKEGWFRLTGVARIGDGLKVV